MYAAGDAANSPLMALTPVAVFESEVAASNMLKGTKSVPDHSGVPPRSSRSPSSPESACSNRKLLAGLGLVQLAR